jgi:hypothetical protein
VNQPRAAIHNAILRADIGRKTQPALQVSRLPEQARAKVLADREMRAAFDGLAARPELRADPDLAIARANYARFSEVRTQILSLSRENTNVRSLAISLDQKRKVMLTCQDALFTLQQEIAGEPAPVAPSNPRKLNAEPQTTH